MDWVYFPAILAAILSQYVSGEQPEVTIPHGKLKGVYRETKLHKKVSAFLGIPYAKPPVGNLRFTEPQDFESWLGFFNASQLPPDCLQYSYPEKLVQGSEDCLYLSIFVPEEPGNHEDQLLDVIVNIHPGFFMGYSSSHYGPEYLLDREVILVNFNYRLGILGFMSTGDSVLPGNNGLKDQLLALKWVQKNIQYFGGDPNKVTLVGGASTHYHVISPKSNGLFNRAIIISGSVLCPWAQTENAQEKAITLAQQLGCPVSNSNEMIECLQQRNANHIVELTGLFLVWQYIPFSPFGPVVEPSHPNAFIDHPPSFYIRNRLAKDIPLLISLTADEGLFPGAEYLSDVSHMQYLDDNWEQLVPHLLDFNFTIPATQHESVSGKIIDEYFGNDDIKDSKKALIELLGDRHFYLPLSQTAKMHASYQKSPVYTMLFSHIGNIGFQDIFNLSREVYPGASHGDDLPYVLRSNDAVLDNDPTAMAMSKLMVDCWMGFINGPNFSSEWKPLQNSLSEFSYMNIGSPDPSFLHFASEIDFGRESFWKTISFQEDSGYFEHTHDSKNQFMQESTLKPILHNHEEL